MAGGSEGADCEGLRLLGAVERISDRRVLTLAAVAVVVSSAAAAGLSIADAGAPASTWITAGINFALAVASGLFLTAGALRLCRWRILSDARSALMGSALVVMGGVGLPLGGIARLLDPTHLSMAGPLIRGVSSVVCMGLVLRAVCVWEVPDRERPGRLLPWLALLVASFFVVTTLLQSLAPHVLDAGAPARVTLSALLASGWFTISLKAAINAVERPWAGHVAPLIAGMGVAELLRAVDQGRTGIWMLAALLLTATLAALAARCALRDLDDGVHVDQARRTDVSSALDDARVAADNQQSWREEMTHDARNAFAGLRATLVMLERYDDRLDVGMISRLRRAALDEIGHLEHLVVTSEVEQRRTFDVSEVVGMVVETRRALGSQISLLSSSTRGYGRPADLATVLQNLLVNAEIHAPGSPVVVDVVADERTVAVAVADRGPGLDASAAAEAFERGSRGAASGGSGLGLYVARSLMRAQGGDLRLRRREGGATFVLSLPTRPTAPELTEPAPATLVPTTLVPAGTVPHQRAASEQSELLR